MPNQHVVPNEGQWAVRPAGSSRVTLRTDTQAEAIRVARGISQRQGTELFVHGRDGRIRERDSHGRDSCPPPG